jgi:hypothetical protein
MEYIITLSKNLSTIAQQAAGYVLILPINSPNLLDNARKLKQNSLQGRNKMLSVIKEIIASQQFMFIILFAGIAVVAVMFLLLGIALGRFVQKRTQDALIRSVRADAVKRSRAVIGGQVSEQIAPFLPGFPCSPLDVRFIGKPIDFIGFSGLSQNKVDEILFIEVKTGTSTLSAREAEIKNAVKNGKVRYVEYHAD